MVQKCARDVRITEIHSQRDSGIRPLTVPKRQIDGVAPLGRREGHAIPRDDPEMEP